MESNDDSLLVYTYFRQVIFGTDYRILFAAGFCGLLTPLSTVI